MSNQIDRSMSDYDRTTLALYRQLTPDEREQVNAYLWQLLASRYTPGRSASSEAGLFSTPVKIYSAVVFSAAAICGKLLV